MFNCSTRFFLTGLAYGLAWANRTAIDNLEAKAFIVSDSSNLNISQSSINQEQISHLNFPFNKLNVQRGVVYLNGKDDDNNKVNVTFFGIDNNSSIFPKIIKGLPIKNEKDIIISNSIHIENNINIGDFIQIANINIKFNVVGITKNSKYNITPVIYASANNVLPLVRKLEFGKNIKNYTSSIVLKNTLTDAQRKSIPKELQYISKNDLIKNIPGYQAQVLTFLLMIIFLIIIAAIIIAIFMFILTMQKKNIFGIMKAQGIPTVYISKSVIIQTLLVTLVGIFIGLTFTIVASYFMPAKVPFLNNYLFYFVISIFILITSLIGTIFSVRIINKIDPLKAIS